LGLGGAMANALGGEQDDLARALAMSLGENVMVSTDPTTEGADGRSREDQVRRCLSEHVDQGWGKNRTGFSGTFSTTEK
jgi:Ubiquitin interaction motif